MIKMKWNMTLCTCDAIGTSVGSCGASGIENDVNLFLRSRNWNEVQFGHVMPFASGLTVVSKKGMDPSSLLSSTVNLMAGSTLLMCWRKPCLLTSLWMTKVSSTNLCQNLGGLGQYLELFVLSLHVEVGHNGANWGTHGSTLNLFIELVLERKVGVLETKLQ